MSKRGCDFIEEMEMVMWVLPSGELVCLNEIDKRLLQLKIISVDLCVSLNFKFNYACVFPTRMMRNCISMRKIGMSGVLFPKFTPVEESVLSSTGVNLVSSASGSLSHDNTKNTRIRQTQKKDKKNKVEDHLTTVKSSLNKASVVDSKATSSVLNFVSNVNSNLKCASCNGCLLSNNHDVCVVAYKNSVNASNKSKSVKTPVKRKVWKTIGKVFKSVGHIWKPTGRIFTLVGNVCPWTRIATSTIVPPRELIPKRLWQPPVLLKIVPLFVSDMERLRISFCTVSYNQRLISESSLVMLRLRKVSEFINGVQDELSKQYTFNILCTGIFIDELTTMASEQCSLGPALNEMTPGTISSGLVPTTSPSTSYVPPSRNDWDLLFHPMFDELLNPPLSVVNQTPEAIAPIAEVIPLGYVDSTGLPFSTTVDQDAPSTSNSPTPTEIQSSVIPQNVRDDNLDIEVAHMEYNTPCFWVIDVVNKFAMYLLYFTRLL
nr:hypothetical protein [Tanacetum cinerariifolium]